MPSYTAPDIGRPALFITRALAVTFTFVATGALAAEISTGIDSQAQLPYWQVADPGMSLRLVQRQPIQTRAFFLARGFNAAQADAIAASCVFQTIFRNTSHETASPATLSYHQHDWVITHSGRTTRPKTREDWAAEWQQAGVAKPVQLAFEWAMYPTEQDYQPGDYNWGMTIFNLPPGSRFTLEVTWTQHGQRNSAVLTGMECATDPPP